MQLSSVNVICMSSANKNPTMLNRISCGGIAALTNLANAFRRPFPVELNRCLHCNEIIQHTKWRGLCHYIDVKMTTVASQITSLTVVYSTVYSAADQRKHQSSASLAFVWGIHRDRWIPRTKGQLRGKCFHLMTSSCNIFCYAIDTTSSVITRGANSLLWATMFKVALCCHWRRHDNKDDLI